mmetsp:Transcript_10205/g.12382  ORF Transcript_10205/g.12382 Transcript_10205/m.12382 type:complete len:153 (-) Transcript_10205:148-606(-)
MASGVCGGTEECWNVKDLIRRVCVALGSEHPSPQSLSWVENRVGAVTLPLQKKIGNLDTWLERFHGEVVFVKRSGDSVEVSLTENGAEKYAPTRIGEGDSEGITPNELAIELRGNVFNELKIEADKRRASGTMFIPKQPVPNDSNRDASARS